MSWSRDSGRRGYHHGNLREALIRAALDLIAEKGIAVSPLPMRRARGRQLGRPYRISAIARRCWPMSRRRGFELFEARLAAAWNDGAPIRSRRSMRWAAPILPSRATSRRSIRRCRGRHPARYGSRIAPSLGSPPSRSCAKPPEALTANLPKENRPPALMMSLHVWALTHGIASLFGAAMPAGAPCRWPSKTCWKRHPGLLRGLGLLDPPKRPH